MTKPPSPWWIRWFKSGAMQITLSAATFLGGYLYRDIAKQAVQDQRLDTLERQMHDFGLQHQALFDGQARIEQKLDDLTRMHEQEKK